MCWKVQYDTPPIIIIPTEWIIPQSIHFDPFELKNVISCKFDLCKFKGFCRFLRKEKQKSQQTDQKLKKKQMKPSSGESAKTSLFRSFMFQRSGVKDKDTVMSAKVNMEAPPKEPDSVPLDPPVLSPKEDVLISVSDSVAKKSRPPPHTTTAFLLQGELRARGGSLHRDRHSLVMFEFILLVNPRR